MADLNIAVGSAVQGASAMELCYRQVVGLYGLAYTVAARYYSDNYLSATRFRVIESI